MTFKSNTHEETYYDALQKYGITRPTAEQASLIYCISAVTTNINRFIRKEGSSLYIIPSALNGELSSGEYIIVSLGYHLYTWRDEYIVPEIDLCKLNESYFEVFVQALRIRTNNL